MASTPYNATGAYQPSKTIGLPALYAWPPRPLKTLRYLFYDLLFPWGYLYIGLAFFTWHYLTPPLETMATFEPGWIGLLWLRNAALLTLFVGGLHWWLYIRRGQGKEYKFDDKWPATDNPKFLWRHQVRDNMFWSIASGVTFWTAYEALTYWIYANGYVASPGFVDHPAYIALMLVAVYFWSTLHFYFVHRFMHYQPVYKVVHELHHRNINTIPWTGISMHPFEHAIYFTIFALWWVVPVHPVVIVLTGLFQGIGPSPSHSGFDFIKIGSRFKVSTGDWYHQLHHQYFNFNYGNTTTPLDKVFGSWHDGSRDSLQTQKERKRKQRRAAA